MTAKQPKFDLECGLVRALCDALTLPVDSYEDPHAGNVPERGVDVIAHSRGMKFGVQVTTPDFGVVRGADRSSEAKAYQRAKNETDGVYFHWGTGNPNQVLNSFRRSIEEKSAIAKRHDFSTFSEAWLLISCGVPIPGAVVSTFLPPWVDTGEIDRWTQKALRNSSYNRVFIHSISDPVQRLWVWTALDRRWVQLLGPPAR